MAKEKKEKQVKKVHNSVELFKQLLWFRRVKKKEFLWQEIVGAITGITKTRTKEVEDILVKLIEFEGKIRLSPDSDIPGVMSPEDTLKSLAIQTLSEWTGRKHLKTFKKICAKTESPILSQIAKVYIERFGGEP